MQNKPAKVEVLYENSKQVFIPVAIPEKAGRGFHLLKPVCRQAGILFSPNACLFGSNNLTDFQRQLDYLLQAE